MLQVMGFGKRPLRVQVHIFGCCCRHPMLSFAPPSSTDSPFSNPLIQTQDRRKNMGRRRVQSLTSWYLIHLHRISNTSMVITSKACPNHYGSSTQGLKQIATLGSSKHSLWQRFDCKIEDVFSFKILTVFWRPVALPPQSIADGTGTWTSGSQNSCRAHG